MSIQASNKLDEARQQMKELISLKQPAAIISDAQKSVDQTTKEIVNLETELSATGSTKTADDVQIELDKLTGEMYVSHDGIGLRH